MRVFVAGASGAIGRPLVSRLRDAGHQVTGMTRSAEKARALEQSGVGAVVADIFDAAAVESAMRAAHPEAVVHQLTDLPAVFDPRRVDYTGTNRLRREGTSILVAAARAAGARRLIAQSIAFLYAPEGDAVKGENARPFVGAPAPLGEALAAVLDLEQQVLHADGLDGVVLRYGYFYGPGTHFAADGSIAAEVRRRRFPVVGSGGGVFSFIHVDDAAAATVAAVEGGVTGIFNVVDDDPAPTRVWLPAYAAALGAPRPLRIPTLLARLVAGRLVAESATRQRGASNAKAGRELGWRPALPSWRQGFVSALG
jgi:nucleoside-diphosphate-sugar epimerase